MPIPGSKYAGGIVGKLLLKGATKGGSETVVSKAVSTITKNAQNGKTFADKVAKGMKKGYKNPQREITVKTKSGTKTRVDNIGTRNGKVKLVEAKSSQRARLTPNQKKAFAGIEKSGATVVGKGKPGYRGGTTIEPQKVRIIRGEQ